ncbi:CDP-glycerol glycerophosphotransferase family protein [Petralouisia muris]|uniref:CDP-glycerol glycerophosphotransferase family protein n=1 Tax=Petralouisia muris TaxID=3032872 RepID=A0AC61RVM7_9FIRM|nr:CDP-glycerol glycerophosphotransferase family protein [Petralouisia muris]
MENMGKTAGKNIIRRIFKFLVYKILFPGTYHIGALRKIKKGKTLFAELHGRALSDNFRLLKEEAEQKYGFQIQEYYLDFRKDSLSYYRRCLGLLWEASDASYIFLNDSCNVLGAFHMRRGSQMIQTWHACGAFKKWGFSAADQEYGESRKELMKYPYHRNYTLVTVSSPEVIWAYREAFQVPAETIQPLGVSRTDLYFLESFHRAAKKNYLKQVPQGKGKKCILYVPTFRGTGGRADSPEILDYAFLKQRLGQDYIILEKRHPFVKETLKPEESLKDFVFGDCGLEIAELLCIADICVTDYSSVAFEYALMERPMIFLAYDLEEYFAHRGFYYEYQEFVPGPVVKDTPELAAAVRTIEQHPEEAREKITEFRQKFMSSCDGHTTERIWQEILKYER